ncbi:MAG: TATA-box-binding family protein [Methanomicrobiales archaeon]|nr:TATA-box-binding family protein [Methanomicrobiales archaeon]
MEITNVVATATLTTPLDLEHLQQHIEGSVLQKATGHWLKYRLQPENRYIAFYKSGKFLITGRGVIESLDPLVQRILALIRSAGVDADVLRVDINNIVAKDTVALGAPLEAVIASLDPRKAEYEPEQFPALIYKDWGVTFLLFSSGSVIITGAKSVDIASEALRQFETLLARIG